MHKGGAARAGAPGSRHARTQSDGRDRGGRVDTEHGGHPQSHRSMRERADRLAPVVTIDGFWRDNRPFFNQGSSDQWRSFINDDDLARYEARVKELAPPHLAAW